MDSQSPYILIILLMLVGTIVAAVVLAWKNAGRRARVLTAFVGQYLVCLGVVWHGHPDDSLGTTLLGAALIFGLIGIVTVPFMLILLDAMKKRRS